MRPSVAIKEVAEDLEGSKFVADPEPTRYGITQGVYDTYRRLKRLSPRSVAQITPAEYTIIYSGNYWDPIKASQLPDGLDFALFQFGVNAGTGTAVRTLQRLVGAAQDGVMGPQTLAAVSKQDPKQLTDRLLQAQDDYYDSIYKANPTRNKPYIEGWHNRVTRTRLFLATGLTKNQAAGGAGTLLLLLLLLLAVRA